MKIVFLLPAGTIEWEVPEAARTSFAFQGFVASIRSAGYFQSENIYLRHETMIGILHILDGAPVNFKPPGATVQ